MNDMTVDEREEKVSKVSLKYKFANVAKRCKWSQTVANGRKSSQNRKCRKKIIKVRQNNITVTFHSCFSYCY